MTGAATAAAAQLPPDVAAAYVAEAVQPIQRRRGWVAVPTYDMRQYVQTQILTVLAGFAVGVGVGAIFGNFLAGRAVGGAVTKVIRNRRSRRNSRRTSARRRKRGRPAGRAAHEPGMTVTIDRVKYDVDVVHGNVMYAGRRMGNVYDLGTSFRAIPRGAGQVRSFGTLAGAVKHVLREAMAA